MNVSLFYEKQDPYKAIKDLTYHIGNVGVDLKTINENREEFQISENLFNFITNLQDEVHKTAIEYHRKVRDREMTKSKLDYIDGIGEKKRTELLKKFGSVKKIKEATVEEIASVKGINTTLAEKIKKEL